MNNLKRITGIFLCLLIALMCFSFVGCKKDETPDIPPQPTDTITLDKTECTVLLDDEIYLTATTNVKGVVSWTSSDRTIASVDTKGRVLAKKVGVATVTAIVGEVTASCKVIVVENTTQGLSKIQVNDSLFLSLAEGAVKLNANYVDKDGQVDASKTLSFTSSDESIVTVSADGTVTPIALGSAAVTVECEGLRSTVVADVYTAAISTPQEWMAVIANSGHYPDKIKPADRYYLKNDIDFSGVEYDIGNTANGSTSEDGNAYHFASEINGNYHSVKNITSWKVDAEKNPQNEQSIFGRVIGATIKNIAFENVVFNSSYSLGLASVTMHHFSKMDGIGKITNLFENISADFRYGFDQTNGKGSVASGITYRAYGMKIKNIFVRMRSADDASLSNKYDNVYGCAYAEWVWYGGSMSNVITLVQDGSSEARFINDAAGDQVYKHSKTNCVAVNTVIQAVYYANQYFDRNVWNVTDPLSVPTFR